MQFSLWWKPSSANRIQKKTPKGLRSQPPSAGFERSKRRPQISVSIIRVVTGGNLYFKVEQHPADHTLFSGMANLSHRLRKVDGLDSCEKCLLECRIVSHLENGSRVAAKHSEPTLHHLRLQQTEWKHIERKMKTIFVRRNSGRVQTTSRKETKEIENKLNDWKKPADKFHQWR
jgi:hypothetical protein